MRTNLVLFFLVTTAIVASVVLIDRLRLVALYFGLPFGILLFSWNLSQLLAAYVFKPCYPKIDPSDKAVVITGCDSGFGHLAALALNKYGFTVFATCLNPRCSGAKKLITQATNPAAMTVIKMDVTRDEDITNAFHQISWAAKISRKPVWGLVNNAGIARTGEIEWGTFDYHYYSMFQVNTFGVIRVTRKFLPLVRKSRGRVINITSTAGRISWGNNVAYSMTKYADIAFSEGLKREMFKFGVKVINIEPYFYKTEMTNVKTALLEKNWQLTSEQIRQDYGLAYFTRLRTVIKEVFYERGVRNYPEEVSTAVLTALCSTEPEYRYVCCAPLMRPLVTLFSTMPDAWSDLIWLLGTKLLGISKPKPVKAQIEILESAAAEVNSVVNV